MPTNVGPGLETRGRRRQGADPNAPVTVDMAHAVIGQALQVIDAFDGTVARCVAVLRSYGKSWHYVGQATGLTAEGARQKFQPFCDGVGIPRRVTQADVAELVAALPPAAVVFGGAGP